jgi:hypothetical protein
MDGLFVLQHLGAEQAAGDGMIRVAGYPDGEVALNLNQQAAGIGAVIGADGTMIGFHGDLL